MAIDYETQLNKIKEAQKQSAIADLENTRNQALSDLQAEREENQRNYAAQRNQANIQNQIQAKNFKEYLVNSGRSNSGIMPQYEINRQNNLQRSLNDITGNENIALADINRRNTLINQNYNTGLQSANANIEANYLTNLLQQQQAAWEREMQERQLALQSAKSSGGSSRSSSSTKSASNNTSNNASNKVTYSKSGNNKIVVSSQTKQGGWVDNLVQAYKGSDGRTYYKDKNGNFVLYK